MFYLRHFKLSDNKLVSLRFNITAEEADSIINQWNAGFFNGKYFEMFAIQGEKEKSVVGTISLYEHSKSIISIGPDIFKEYRQRGFAKAAMAEAMRVAKQKKMKLYSNKSEQIIMRASDSMSHWDLKEMTMFIKT